jgi:hypothetical protein
VTAWQHSADWLDGDVQAYVDGCVRNAMQPLHGLACMFNESGASSDARNPRDLSKPAVAVGLIQFTHAWLGKGVNLDDFRANDTAHQLPFVERFFASHKGKLTSVELVYLSMFLPAWLDKAPTLVQPLCAPQGPYAWAYRPNGSLDMGGKGWICLLDLRMKANAAARGARWDELSGRVIAAMQDRTTEPELPTYEEFPANDDGDEPPEAA